MQVFWIARLKSSPLGKMVAKLQTINLNAITSNEIDHLQILHNSVTLGVIGEISWLAKIMA